MPPRRYQPRRGPRPPRRRNGGGGAAVADAPATPVRPAGPVELPSSIAVKDLADALTVSTADVIKELIRNGIFATINQSIDFDTASLVAGELGIETVERGAAERAAAEAAGPASAHRPPRRRHRHCDGVADAGLFGADIYVVAFVTSSWSVPGSTGAASARATASARRRGSRQSGSSQM